jgi:hypothetical protein
VFNVLYDGQPLLLFVEISPRFPEDQPALALQSVRCASFFLHVFGLCCVCACMRLCALWAAPPLPIPRPKTNLQKKHKKNNQPKTNNRRAGPDGCAAYSTYPWSPRWGVDEMAARIFNFVREEAANAAARLHGGGGSGGAAA